MMWRRKLRRRTKIRIESFIHFHSLTIHLYNESYRQGPRQKDPFVSRSVSRKQQQENRRQENIYSPIRSLPSIARGLDKPGTSLR